jgi:hypothetical protein
LQITHQKHSAYTLPENDGSIILITLLLSSKENSGAPVKGQTVESEYPHFCYGSTTHL